MRTLKGPWKLVAAVATSLGTVLGLGMAAPSVAAPNTAVNAVPTETAQTWNFIRQTCRTLPSGVACLSLQGNGQPSTYRLILTVKPNAGQWMQRLSLTDWSGKNYWEFGGSGSGTTWGKYNGAKSRYMCSGGPCEKTTTMKTWVIPTSLLHVYTVVLETPQGRYELNAGVTPKRQFFEKGCFSQSVVIPTWYMSSRNTNQVYLVQHMEIKTNIPQPSRMTARLMNDESTVLTHTFLNIKRGVHYRSPAVVTAWQRKQFTAPADLQEPSVAPETNFWRTQTVSAISNANDIPTGVGCVM